MKVTATTLPDVKLIEPDIFPDDRGVFFESFNAQKYADAGITENWIQDSVSVSRQGVLRGLHFQSGEYAQAKLVMVVEGEVFDVAVDMRPESATRGKWFGTVLSVENHNQLYIPKGFAHGFYVVSTQAVFHYKLSDNYYVKEAATGIIWNDPNVGVAWPLLPGTTPILSTQDAALPAFA